MADSVSIHLERSGEVQDGGTWDYRPWGTRTIKFQISTKKDLPPLRLRWTGTKRKNGLACEFVGDYEEFVISWGGGHDEDTPVRTRDKYGAFEEIQPVLASEKPNNVYFNITHAGDSLPEEVPLTLEAYPDGGGDAVAAVVVKLTKPANVPDNVLRIVAAEPTKKWVVNHGVMAPLYDCRWWSSRDVVYESVQTPPLVIQREGNALLVQWDGATVAQITDQTRPPVLDQSNDVQFELFQFITPGREYFALRAWFFWLDKNVKVLSVGGLGRHEVPDAERFDLLLRKKDGVVTLACTDLHWREMWGQVIEAPLQATIGLNFKQKVLLGEEKLGSVFGDHKHDDGRRDYNPIGLIERLAEDLVSDDEDLTMRAKGSEAHVPMLNNVQQVTVGDDGELIVTKKGTSTEHEMTSSDVRLVR
jgi:hypothetical protein